jgi:hypothetical protein
MVGKGPGAADRLDSKAEARPACKAADRLDSKAADRLDSKAAARPAIRAAARPAIRAAARPGYRAAARPGYRAVARPGYRAVARPGRVARATVQVRAITARHRSGRQALPRLLPASQRHQLPPLRAQRRLPARLPPHEPAVPAGAPGSSMGAAEPAFGCRLRPPAARLPRGGTRRRAGRLGRQQAPRHPHVRLQPPVRSLSCLLADLDWPRQALAARAQAQDARLGSSEPWLQAPPRSGLRIALAVPVRLIDPAASP